jgi:benzoate/toluate 1,2-dioxygenase subunit beta
MSTASAVTLEEVEQFLYREARLADEHAYDEWEALWTEDAVYWVPAHPALAAGRGRDSDPMREMSIIYDNRSRIGTRIKQLHTGKRHSQNPPSSIRRLVSNVELLGEEEGDVLVGANFLAVESRERGTELWGGRVEYRLRPTLDGLRMARKTVLLVDGDRALSTMSFLI